MTTLSKSVNYKVQQIHRPESELMQFLLRKWCVKQGELSLDQRSTPKKQQNLKAKLNMLKLQKLKKDKVIARQTEVSKSIIELMKIEKIEEDEEKNPNYKQSPACLQDGQLKDIRIRIEQMKSQLDPSFQVYASVNSNLHVYNKHLDNF